MLITAIPLSFGAVAAPCESWIALILGGGGTILIYMLLGDPAFRYRAHSLAVRWATSWRLQSSTRWLIGSGASLFEDSGCSSRRFT